MHVYIYWSERDQSWNCFKGNTGETPVRRDGACNYGLFRAHRYHLEMNWTELNWRAQTLIYDAVFNQPVHVCIGWSEETEKTRFIMRCVGEGVAQLVERRPRDPIDSLTRDSNPVRSTRIKLWEFFRVKMLCWLVGVPHTCVYTNAKERTHIKDHVVHVRVR